MMAPTLLWSVEGLHGISYLFGSIHIRDRRAFNLVDQLIPFMAACTSYGAELELDKHADYQLDTTEEHLNSWSYQSALTNSKYSRLKKMLLKQYKLDLRQMDAMHPLILMQYIQSTYLEDDYPVSLDHTLWNQAVALDKKTVGLETWEEQINMYKRLTQSNHLSQLFNFLESKNKIEKEIRDVMQLYNEQEIHKLYKKTRKSLGKNRKWMINHRNQIMADRFVQVITNGTIFASIGAAHLSGKFGVLRKIKHAGFKVDPVILKP